MTESMTIYIDHEKVLRFEELALNFANSIDCHIRIDVNINREKTKAYVHLLLMNYEPNKIDSLVFIEPRQYEEFKSLALEIARKSNTGIKIEVSFNQEKTKAEANIVLLKVNK